MKELSIEGKATRYDQAIKVAKSKIRNDKDHVLYEDDVMEIFPELKESEGEKIRKALIERIRGIYKGSCTEEAIKERDEFIAYLEKIPTDEEMKELLRTEYEKGRADALAEKKPVDKVEPKFKVGDWLIRNDMVGVSCCITQIHEPYYYSTTDHTFISFREEDKYRLWTIQDARDGDVLVSQSQCGLGTWYGIFKSLDDNESMTVRCYLAMDGRFETRKEWCFDKDVSDVKPATKEQRERFFAAMLDAGYEWDADKKELKKIEQDPAWSEEDEKTFNKSVEALEELGKEITKDKETATKFLKSAGIMDENGELAEPYRVCESTSNWSEEDERILNGIIDFIDSGNVYNVSKINMVSWLKYLRHQNTWKPSDAQMIVLNDIIINGHLSNANERILKGLQEQLKKLREE